jgi:hypothetical protein
MTDLSPAAKVVLDAAADVYWDWSDMSPASSSIIAAAALRAAADQVAPLSTNLRQNDIRFGLLRIATELEAQ